LHLKLSALAATILFLLYSDTSAQEQLDVSLEQILERLVRDSLLLTVFSLNSQLQDFEHLRKKSHRESLLDKVKNKWCCLTSM